MRRFINFANAANFSRSRSGLIPDLLLVKSKERPPAPG